MRLDLAFRASGEPASQREPKPCATTFACALVAVNARLEYALALVGSDAGAVVIDRVANRAVSPFDRNEDRARGVELPGQLSRATIRRVATAIRSLAQRDLLAR
jgi:hypothetical protein